MLVSSDLPISAEGAAVVATWPEELRAGGQSLFLLTLLLLHLLCLFATLCCVTTTATAATVISTIFGLLRSHPAFASGP